MLGYHQEKWNKIIIFFVKVKKLSLQIVVCLLFRHRDAEHSVTVEDCPTWWKALIAIRTILRN
jgi:hypothetical protein